MSKEGRCFTPEFKAEAVRLAERRDKSIRAVAGDLGIHETVLKRWRHEMQKAQKEGTRFAPGNGRARDAELEQLKRELATVKLERDLLKRQQPTSHRTKSEIGIHRISAWWLVS